MPLAIAARSRSRFWRGEYDLISALYQLVFGYVALIVTLLAVLETASLVFDRPGLSGQFAQPLAGLYLLWASIGVWRSARRRQAVTSVMGQAAERRADRF